MGKKHDSQYANFGWLLPNLSFFGKYVKRYLGVSPKQYREQLSSDTSSKISD